MPRTGSTEDQDRYFLYGNEEAKPGDTKKLLILVTIIVTILLIMGFSETVIPAIKAALEFYG